MESAQENHKIKNQKSQIRKLLKKIEGSALVKAAIEKNNIQHIGEP
jgi:hypothetical protein